MIIAWFLAKWRWLAICAALIGMAYLKGCGDGKASERAAQAIAAAEQAELAREADVKAREAVAGTVKSIDGQNDRARAAASRSDDPLAAGLRELRK